MSLIPVAFPQSEPELMMMRCALEAGDVEHLVQGSAFGSLFPGAHISWYNERRILVDDRDAWRARQALADFLPPADEEPEPAPTEAPTSIPAPAAPKGLLRRLFGMLLRRHPDRDANNQ